MLDLKLKWDIFYLHTTRKYSILNIYFQHHFGLLFLNTYDFGLLRLKIHCRRLSNYIRFRFFATFFVTGYSYEISNILRHVNYVSWPHTCKWLTYYRRFQAYVCIILEVNFPYGSTLLFQDIVIFWKNKFKVSNCESHFPYPKKHICINNINRMCLKKIIVLEYQLHAC